MKHINGFRWSDRKHGVDALPLEQQRSAVKVAEHPVPVTSAVEQLYAV